MLEQLGPDHKNYEIVFKKLAICYLQKCFEFKLLYPWAEGDELEDALDGEEEGEDQVEVAEDVGEVERGSVELKEQQV